MTSREELLSEVWCYNSIPATRTADVHIAWLRQKLKEKRFTVIQWNFAGWVALCGN